jgi:hypothetical protein
MKRITTITLALCLLTIISASAFATEIYPADVQENGSEIIRVYELGPDESPEDIPRSGFERGGLRYELTEIVRQETELADTVEHTETVTVDSATKELEEILPMLASTLDFVSEDGYAGTLLLDVSTIKTEVAGTTQQAYTMKTTREYPRLSANDTSLIPKTVTERGLTYALSNVDWRAGNLATVDYDELPEYYTAVATYAVSGSSTKVTGYTTTAEYRGEIVKQLQGKTRYTAYFEGTPLATPTPAQTPAPLIQIEPTLKAFNPIPFICVAGGVLILGAGGFVAYKKLKGKIRKF